MWPVVEGAKAGQIPERRPPEGIPRKIGKLVLWIVVATVLVFVFNLMRG
jgi:hypothetical protein